MSSKIARGSLIMLIGYFIFRVGGYFYRFATAYLLGPAGFGILNLALPTQSILIQIASGGMPPAIAKHVSEYSAKGDEEMVKQVIHTSLKIVIILGLFFSSAIILILVGFYVAGAVIGTAIGFLFSALAGYYLYRRGLGKRLKDVKLSFTLKQELSLAKVLIIFAFPVLVTGLAETALFDAIGNFIVGAYLASEQLGFYGAATPVARLPLIISMAVATAVLPATAEAMGLKNRHVLKGYVNQSYRYVSLVVLPMCVGTFIFATPIMKLLYVNPAFMNGAAALQILAVGMLFFTIYTVSSSIAQGLGKPYLPMIILIAGVILDVALSTYLIPIYGITGAAAATTITALFIMTTIVWKTLQVANVKLEYKDLGRIALAAGIMGAVLLLIPQNLLISQATLNFAHFNYIAFFSKYVAFFLVIILAAIVYVVALILVGGLKNSDINALRKLSNKTGPLKGKLGKIISLMERFAH